VDWISYFSILISVAQPTADYRVSGGGIVSL